MTVHVRHFAPAVVPKDPNLLSGAARGALERIRATQAASEVEDLVPNTYSPPQDAVIVRSHNSPALGAPPKQAYPGHPHNFTSLRPISPGFDHVDRAVRDFAWESRFDLLNRIISPRYYGEVPFTTPRRERQDGVVDGIRVRPVQNPSVKLTPAIRYRLNAWPSKDWGRWDPSNCHIRGSRRRYRVPQDIAPYRDELGEWHKPRVSGRYKGDIEKQYYMHTLPWVWSNNYFHPPLKFLDREPRGLKRWYKKEFRKAHIAEALKRADSMIEDYRKETRERKRLSWVETIALEFAGEQMAAPYIRQRRVPKM